MSILYDHLTDLVLVQPFLFFHDLFSRFPYDWFFFFLKMGHKALGSVKVTMGKVKGFIFCRMVHWSRKNIGSAFRMNAILFSSKSVWVMIFWLGEYRYTMLAESTTLKFI